MPVARVRSEPKHWNAAYAELKTPKEQEAFLRDLVANHLTDAAVLLDFLEKLPVSRLRNGAIVETLQILAQNRPLSAIERIPRLLTGPDAHNAYVAAAEIWGRTDPKAALGWITLQPRSDFSAVMLEQIVSSGASDNARDVRDILTSTTFQTPQDRELAFRALAGVWAQSEPVEAIAWARQVATNTGSSEALSIGYLNWSTIDPAAASSSVLKEDGNFVARVLPEIAGIFASNSPEAAAKWTATLPATASKTAAVTAVAQTWAELNPGAAMSWAVTQPAETRSAAMLGTALKWSRMDVDGYKAFTETLSPQMQTELNTLLANASQPRREPLRNRPLLQRP